MRGFFLQIAADCKAGQARQPERNDTVAQDDHDADGSGDAEVGINGDHPALDHAYPAWK